LKPCFQPSPPKGWQALFQKRNSFAVCFLIIAFSNAIISPIQLLMKKIKKNDCNQLSKNINMPDVIFVGKKCQI